jgi:hypothetical protein
MGGEAGEHTREERRNVETEAKATHGEALSELERS